MPNQPYSYPSSLREPAAEDQFGYLLKEEAEEHQIELMQPIVDYMSIVTYSSGKTAAYWYMVRAGTQMRNNHAMSWGGRRVEDDQVKLIESICS